MHRRIEGPGEQSAHTITMPGRTECLNELSALENKARSVLVAFLSAVLFTCRAESEGRGLAIAAQVKGLSVSTTHRFMMLD